MSEKLGVMLCGHGSRDADAVREFAVLSEHLKRRLPQYPVEYGYLEFATPIIRTGLDKLREQGVNRVLAVPGMLFAAGHAKNDIPSVLNTYAAQNELRIDYGKELGIDPKMMRAAADRVQEALDAAGPGVPLHETLLVVVGRGASDPDANSNVSKVTRLSVGGLRLRLGRDGLFRGYLSAGRAGARACRAAGLSPDRRVSLFSLHRHSGPTHL